MAKRFKKLKGSKTRDVVIRTVVGSTVDLAAEVFLIKGARRVESEASRRANRTTQRPAMGVGNGVIRTVQPVPSKITETLADISKAIGVTFVRHDGLTLVTATPGRETDGEPPGAMKG